MKKLVLLDFAAISLSITGCDEDFEVAAPYKNITIVYAMLNHADSVHYIRIQKAFMDANKSAIDMAKVSDSSFYPEDALEVEIREIFPNGTVVTDPNLAYRVNMDNENVVKEPGTFFTTPNYAYKYYKHLNKNTRYRRVITNVLTGDVDSAETAIISSDTTQGNFYVLAFGDYNYPPQTLAFRQTTAVGHKYKLPVNVTSPAKVVEGIIRFSYWEVDHINPDQHKFVDFPFATAVVDNGSATLETPNSAFYSFFRTALGEAPASVERFLDSQCVIDVYAGSEDYYTYRKITATQMSGITSTEIKPIYTNMMGTDVYGLFTTRAVRHGINIPIEKVTVDSLASNPVTLPTRLKDKFYGE